jgi:hypothetical protein
MKVARLSTRLEMLAYETPETNLDLPESKFRLADDPEFKRLLPIGHGLAQAVPSPARTSNTRWFLLAANLAVVCGIGFYLALRRRKRVGQ